MAKRLDKFMSESPIYKRNLEYMQTVAPRLLEAEKIVHEIKGSKEWNYTINYFNILYQRGKLACRPTYSNGYTIKPAEAITLDKIADILTEEQRELILKRLQEG